MIHSGSKTTDLIGPKFNMFSLCPITKLKIEEIRHIIAHKLCSLVVDGAVSGILER